MSFRTLMALAAEYDLELDQMDAINAFVNCPLEEEEVVFMKMPPGFERRGKVLRLRKALYGLRRPPLLWQQHLTASLENLGCKTVPQEPCVMMKGAVIVFFYVDDIIWAYRKKDQQVATEAISGLQQRYKMSILGEPKWFLGIHAYIDKIAHKYVPDKLGIKLPSTPMATNEELLSEQIQARDQDKHSYLQKQKLAEFLRLIGLEEIGERLKLEARLEELKDKIKDCREHRMRPSHDLHEH
ncbi:reverse transcriptase (RNA-dependent DNA polymerase) [Hirsutella rhossiliensis]